MSTQLEKALNNEITEEMKYVDEKDNIDFHILRESIAEGKAVILANAEHKDIKKNFNPVGIGYGLRTKVNANIGTSPVKSDLKNELKKLRAAIDAGADTVMDLSLGGNLDEIRKNIIEHSAVPVGSVPIYQAAIEAKSPEKITLEKFLEVFEKHARDGIDFATIHAGVTKKALPLAEKRLMPAVSRGGSFLIRWMKKHNRESFLYENFDEILKIAKRYDVTVSLGDGLRPGCIADANDEAQICELKTLGKLARRCREKGVQVIIEGPGHIPLDEIEKSIKLEKKICNGAPFYVLGPLPTDIAAGYDHIAGAIGSALAGMYGADFLCYVTAKEHIGLPDIKDVREGVVATRIAAHIADIAKGIDSARQTDNCMGYARTELDWKGMMKYSIDPKKFQELFKKECRSNPKISKYCSMCGPYCTEKKKKV